MIYEHAFQPYTYSLRPFSKEGGAWDTPPQAIHRLRPPSLYGVNRTGYIKHCYFFNLSCKLLVLTFLAWAGALLHFFHCHQNLSFFIKIYPPPPFLFHFHHQSITHFPIYPYFLLYFLSYLLTCFRTYFLLYWLMVNSPG